MNSIVISLDVAGERIKNFHQVNSHFSILSPEIFPAIRGTDLTRQEILESQLLTQETLDSGLCTPGSIGVAASMRWIWQQVSNFDEGALVMEDDAITHPDLLTYIHKNQQQLDHNDITFFGYNTDAPLSIETPQGIVLNIQTFPEYPEPDWIEATLNKTDALDATLMKFLKGFGMMCYWISPTGAQKIEELCFPLTLATTTIPLLSHAMPGVSIDRRLCAFYPELNAAITWPPLAYSPNTDSTTR